jgi:D-beta-D-heptose 7-phosphate kinase/D-beta-D-heptose 1-phosphate adenosyltransferase
MTREQLQAILAEFGKLRVLLVGDVCLDRWCVYDPELASASRETGIPRTAVVSYEVTPGGGGTVANNLMALGAGRVDIVAVAGDDANGFELERALRARGINTGHLVRDPARQTFTYTKLINRHTGAEDLPRLDFVNTAPPGAEAEGRMVEALHKLIPGADAVLIADQSEIASGAAVTEHVRAVLLEAARSFPEKIFVADSRAQVEKFAGVVVKPNEDETVEAVRRIAKNGAATDRGPRTARRAGVAVRERGQTTSESPEGELPGVPALGMEDAGEFLRRHLGGRLPLFMTRGAEGALLFAGGPPRLIPARRNDHPVDICGAGDAFESGLALALAATRRLRGSPDYVAAAEVGHLAAAVTITKPGTGTASQAEVLALFDAA